ncbi:MAG: helix-turn-helix domain-containing protein [Clostridiales bacterium]|nr:helix-turn-helix domain-containing protein [Clostridiales bacterium]
MYFDTKECGRRIARLRKQHGLLQREMAEELNVRLDHYRAIEAGRHGYSIDFLVDLAVRMDVSLDYLILGRMNYPDRSYIKNKLNCIEDLLTELQRNL